MLAVGEEAAAVPRIFSMDLFEMSLLKIRAALEADTGMSNRGSKRTTGMILSNKKFTSQRISGA